MAQRAFSHSFCLMAAHARHWWASSRSFVGWRLSLPFSEGSWFDHVWLDGPMVCILAVLCVPFLVVRCMGWGMRRGLARRNLKPMPLHTKDKRA